MKCPNCGIAIKGYYQEYYKHYRNKHKAEYRKYQREYQRGYRLAKRAEINARRRANYAKRKATASGEVHTSGFLTKSSRRFDVDMATRTAYIGNQTWYFKGKYKDGCVLAFYASDPCGTCNNKNVGWGVLDLNKKRVLSLYEIKNWGARLSWGEHWREWLAEQARLHGTPFNTFRDEEGRDVWTMKDS